MIGIKNGHIIDPFTGLDEVLDLILDEPQGSYPLEGPVDPLLVPGDTASAAILEAGKDLDLSGCRKIIDAAGCIVAPGLVDTHVHFRDPGLTYKEDIRTGAAAAKKGGFTTVVMMANTMPTIATPELVKENLAAGAKTGIHLLQAAAVSRDLKGKEMTDFKALAKAGAVGFTDDGIPLMDAAMLKRAMEEAKALDMPISLHEEDPAFIDSPGVNKGKVACAVGAGGADSLSEEVMVARDCAIALATGAKVVIQHISSGRSVDLVRNAKAAGADIYAEATPHHFTLTEEAVLKYGTHARMNPPLRTEWDREKIIEGLKDGTISIIATDHAPHSAEEKSRPFTEAPSGITGLETSLSLGVTTLVKGGHLTMMELLGCMTKSPAELYKLGIKGITPGAPADLVIFAPDEKYTVSSYVSKAVNSPFTGWELYAPIKYTICGGRIVYSR